jgi:uncharacterized protein YvpB
MEMPDINSNPTSDPQMLAEKKQKHLFKLYRFWIFATLILIICSLISYIYYLQQPIKLIYNLKNVSIHKPLKVSFSHEVSTKLKYKLSTKVPGSWKIEKNLIGITSISYIPASQLVPGDKFTMNLSQIETPISNTPINSHIGIPISTESPSGVESYSPKNNSINNPTNTNISLTLQNKNNGLRKFKITSVPAVKFSDFATTDDKTFTWHVIGKLSQGATYVISITDDNQIDSNTQLLLRDSFTIVPEPTITATNKDHFYPGDSININFSQPMIQEQNYFKFNFAGTGKWVGPQLYTFTPTGLAANNRYSYSILKNFTSTIGGLIETDHAYSISTPGPAFVTASGPSGSSVGLNNQIRFSFDQPMNQASAQSSFTITPNVTGTFGWSGNTMIFTPSGYNYQTSYTATIQPGAQSIYGAPTQRPFSTGFSTIYQTIILSVPIYLQTYSLSCEESALRMALAYRGISTTDFGVLMLESYAPRPLDTVNNFWDDPNVMFVGDVNGSDRTKGWGVNPNPIAQASISLGRSATVANGISPSGISDAIHSDKPVVLWGYNGSSAHMTSWNSPNGVITVARNEHVRTVVGVVGNSANPIGFYINDPLYGRIYWTTSQLINNMTLNGQAGSQAVIIN